MARLLPDRSRDLLRKRLRQKRSQTLHHRPAAFVRDRSQARRLFEQVRLSAFQAHDQLRRSGANPPGWSLEPRRDGRADRAIASRTAAEPSGSRTLRLQAAASTPASTSACRQRDGSSDAQRRRTRPAGCSTPPFCRPADERRSRSSLRSPESRRHVAASSGTGKTHIALGLGLAACQKGLSVGFYTAAALVHELLEARDEKRLLRLQRQVAGYKLLIIDELGYVPLSQTGAELLFEIFSQRYERGSTIVTSNLPFDEWTNVFGSERLTGALLDRLTHHVHILEMNGDSYRLNQSKRRSRRASADASVDNPTQA